LRSPLITRLYNRFLDEGNVADFVRSVSNVYSEATLQRIAGQGGREPRRAAVLALTLVGGASSVATVGDALRDGDRGVRLIAEDGIQAMWNRTAAPDHCWLLQRAARLNLAGQFAAAVEVLDGILIDDPEFGAAWHQRALGIAGMGHEPDAIGDFQRALECEPYHFRAALGLAQCYLDAGDLPAAISCLEWSLQIHPHLDQARAQLRRLQRAQREQSDR